MALLIAMNMREGRGVNKKEEREREREYGGVKKGEEKGGTS
jgi:hypothetical protein